MNNQELIESLSDDYLKRELESQQMMIRVTENEIEAKKGYLLQCQILEKLCREELKRREKAK